MIFDTILVVGWLFTLFILVVIVTVGYYGYEDIKRRSTMSYTFTTYSITCLRCRKEHSSKNDFLVEIWLFIHRLFCHGEMKNDI